jgi:hypothetical protein
MAEYRVEQLCRDAKVLQIYGGTDEIQTSQIARDRRLTVLRQAFCRRGRVGMAEGTIRRMSRALGGAPASSRSRQAAR